MNCTSRPLQDASMPVKILAGALVPVFFIRVLIVVLAMFGAGIVYLQFRRVQ